MNHAPLVRCVEIRPRKKGCKERHILACGHTVYPRATTPCWKHRCEICVKVAAVELHEDESKIGSLCCTGISSAKYAADWGLVPDGDSATVLIHAYDGQFQDGQELLIVGEREINEMADFLDKVRKKMAADAEKKRSKG